MKLEKRPSKIDEEDVIKRLMFIMINEAARCLDEQVVDSSATVDIGMIMGTGFPPFRGGLLRYADSVGVRTILDTLKRFYGETGAKRFEPSPYLVRLAQSGAKFHSD